MFITPVGASAMRVSAGFSPKAERMLSCCCCCCAATRMYCTSLAYLPVPSCPFLSQAGLAGPGTLPRRSRPVATLCQLELELADVHLVFDFQGDGIDRRVDRIRISPPLLHQPLLHPPSVHRSHHCQHDGSSFQAQGATALVGSAHVPRRRGWQKRRRCSIIMSWPSIPRLRHE